VLPTLRKLRPGPCTPIGRRGYDEDAVDAVLDQVESALRGAPATGIELNGRPLGE
jgi:DivIVA domain-containing protein